MKMLIPLSLLTVASFVLVAEEDLMSKLDTDNDGKISIEEASQDASLSTMFIELDIDGDGYLSPKELEKYKK